MPPRPCAASKDPAVWAAFHALIKRAYWTDPTFTGPPLRGSALEYRQCLGCGSHLAIPLPASALTPRGWNALPVEEEARG